MLLLLLLQLLRCCYSLLLVLVLVLMLVLVLVVMVVVAAAAVAADAFAITSRIIRFCHCLGMWWQQAVLMSFVFAMTKLEGLVDSLRHNPALAQRC